MRRDRSPWIVLLGALSLACGGVLSAAPSPSASAPPASPSGGSVGSVGLPIYGSSSYGTPVASSAPPATGGFSWKGVPLRLKADRLRVDLAGRKATLEGQVELHREKATLRCERLELRFDERGQVLWARGEGRVVVESPELRAEAMEATFDLEHSRVLLRGPVRAEQGGVRLKAASASVDLFGQQLEMSEVEGSVTPVTSARAAP